MKKNYLIPIAWNVYLVDLGPRIGTKPGKQRPCLSIQPSFFAQNGLTSTLIIPLTTKITSKDAWPLRVRLLAQTCGNEKDSDLLIDQMLAWDNSLFIKKMGELPEFYIFKVKSAILDFLNF